MIELLQTRSLESWRWSRLAQATAGLAISAAAIAWSLALGDGNTPSFLVQNTIVETERRALLLAIAAGPLLALLVVLALLARRRWSALPTIERIGIAVAPLAVLAFLPVLLVPSAWFNNPLPFLTMLTGLVLLLERLLRAWLTEFSPALAALPDFFSGKWPLRVRRFLPAALVLGGAAAFSGFVLYFSVQQHQRMNTAPYDLGIYDNLMFTAISGHPFRSTVLFGADGGNYLAGHAEFAMLLFAPLYWLWPRAEALLTLQAVALGFAAVPLYLFARTQLPRGSAVALALAYLLYAPLHGSCFYDFHWLPTSIIFQFTLYFAIATRRNWLFALCYVILTLIREDVSVGLAVLGTFLLLSGIRPKLGLMMAIASAIAFVAIRFGVMTFAGTWVFPNLIYGQLVAPGEHGFGSVIKTLITNPSYVVGTLLESKKLTYLLHLTAPLAFLPLRRPLLVLLICAGTMFTLLTTAYDPTVSINFQYPTHWIPYLFAAVVLMLGVLSKGMDGAVRRRAALGAVLFGVMTHSYVFGAVLQHQTYVGGFLPIPFKISQTERDTYAALRKVIAKIPGEASVAASDMQVPHVSNRFSVYTLSGGHGDADYLLLDRSTLAYATRKIVTDATSRSDYGFVTKEGQFYLFKRGVITPGTEEALQALGVGASHSKKRTRESGGDR
jgi:uncharacterized membrane protein